MNRYVSLTNEESFGNKTVKTWFSVNMNDESDVCDFANALVKVLSKVCDYDESELEDEWMDMSFDQEHCCPNPEGTEEFFNKYAEEALDALSGLDEDSYDIFRFVEKEEETRPNEGLGDDKYASATFSESKKTLFDKILNS